MGTEETLRSAALPRLLAFVLVVACGGRYASTEQDPGGAGRTGSNPDDDPPPDDEPGTDPGRAGSSTGVGGSSAMGGGSIGTGGSVGVGGSGPIGIAGYGVGGTFIGSGGKSAGGAANNLQVCNDYCSSLGTVCPEYTSQPACSNACFSDILNATPACAPAKRADYACITNAIAPLSSCPGALAISSKLCGSTEGVPAPCYDEPTCPVEISGDSAGCYVIADCRHGLAELHCIETGGVPVCTCYVNGTPALKLMTGAMSSKQACTDEELRRLCMAQLP